MNHSQREFYDEYRFKIECWGFHEAVEVEVIYSVDGVVTYRMVTICGEGLLRFVYKISKMFEALDFNLTLKPTSVDNERYYVKFGKVVPLASDPFF